MLWFSENSRRLWLSHIPCLSRFPGKFRRCWKIVHRNFRQHDMLSLPRFGHFPARKMAAGKSALPSGQEKCRKSASESAGLKRGAEGSAAKVLQVRSPMLPLHRRGAWSTFLGAFLGTPFRTGTSKHFFGTFPGQGFGTSLDGRQDCNSLGKHGPSTAQTWGFQTIFRIFSHFSPISQVWG